MLASVMSIGKLSPTAILPPVSAALAAAPSLMVISKSLSGTSSKASLSGVNSLFNSSAVNSLWAILSIVSLYGATTLTSSPARCTSQNSIIPHVSTTVVEEGARNSTPSLPSYALAALERWPSIQFRESSSTYKKG